PQRYKDLRFDKQLTFDKVTDVYHAAVGHDEDQPAHLHVLDTNICATRCTEEYGNPCQRFCPAAVYEMVDVVPQAASLRLVEDPRRIDAHSEPPVSAGGSVSVPGADRGPRASSSRGVVDATGSVTEPRAVASGTETHVSTSRPLRRQLQINF